MADRSESRHHVGMPSLRVSAAQAQVQNKCGSEWSDEYQLGPLDGVYAKLDQALLHARALEASVTKALDSNRDVFSREVDGTPSKCLFRAGALPDVDTGWSLQLGDFLTNLRAALDHLAWQLVLLEKKNPKGQIYFPICSKAFNKNGNPSARILGVSRESTIQAVEAVQPYQMVDRGLNPDNDSLQALKTLVNIDKHRLLLTTFHGVTIDKVYWFGNEGDPVPEIRMSEGPLKEGDAFAWFDFGEEKAPKSFAPHLELQVFLTDIPGTRPLRNHDVLAFSRRLFVDISDMVIAYHFADLFDETPRYYRQSFDAK